MKKGLFTTKNIILIAVVVLVGGVFAILLGKKRKRDKDADFLKQLQDLQNLNATQLEELKKEMESQSEEEKEQLKEDLLTDIGNVKVGKFAYPSGDYATLRTNAQVNNGFFNNIITEIASPSRIGRIIKVMDSVEYGDKFPWYKVSLNPPFQTFTRLFRFGYVRSDVVTIKNM